MLRFRHIGGPKLFEPVIAAEKYSWFGQHGLKLKTMSVQLVIKSYNLFISQLISREKPKQS